MSINFDLFGEYVPIVLYSWFKFLKGTFSEYKSLKLVFSSTSNSSKLKFEYVFFHIFNSLLKFFRKSFGLSCALIRFNETRKNRVRIFFVFFMYLFGFKYSAVFS